MLSLSSVLVASIEQQDSSRIGLANSSGTRFALDRIERLLRHAPAVVHPKPDSSTNVLAIALDTNLDLDGDGYADADNDKDGRVNEDPGANLYASGVSGLLGVDDDQDGAVDETDQGSGNNDDEDNAADEDPLNGIDDDGDGDVDEDPGDDSNDDGCPGICGVDDDNDGTVDEGNSADDDEDGSIDEDWTDVIIISHAGDSINEAWPVDEATEGTTFTTTSLVDNVSDFSIRRITQRNGWEQVEITVTTDGGGLTETVSRRLSRRMP